MLIFSLGGRVNFLGILKTLAFGRQPHSIAKLHDEWFERDRKRKDFD
jgi:hypothetical protein